VIYLINCDLSYRIKCGISWNQRWCKGIPHQVRDDGKTVQYNKKNNFYDYIAKIIYKKIW